MHYWWSAFLIRCALPCIIGMALIFRPCAMSGLYLLFLLWIPFVPVPTKETMAGHAGIYLKLLIAISVINSLAQVSFQIVLASMGPYGHFLVQCEFLEKLLRHIGLIRMDHLPAGLILTWISPECLMLLFSVLFFLLFRKLVIEHDEGLRELDLLRDETKTRKKVLIFLTAIGRYSVLITLCVSSVLEPSVQGGLYFLVFLGAATWWACYKQLGKSFAIVLCLLVPIIIAHIVVLYLFQFQHIQEIFPEDNQYARYFGLSVLRASSCKKDPRDLTWNYKEWPQWANPIVLYWLYAIVILEAKALLNPELQKKQGPFSRLDSSFKSQLGRGMSQRATKRDLARTAAKTKWQMATRKVREAIRADKEEEKEVAEEDTPLLGGVGSANKRYGSGKKSTIIQDSTGSVTVTGENPEDIPLDEFGTDTPHYEPTIFEKLAYALEAVLQWIIKVSYLGTNIIMMAWSITYLSWLTFVLLLWANLIWAVPNQRKAMLFSSPFLVAYAWFLLLSAYIYSMNLTEAELPSKVQGINLEQIGFLKVTSYPCLPLIVKCLYTTMFWVTLRQYMQERVIKKQSSALADMVAPLQVTVGAATTGQTSQQPPAPSTMDKIGVHLRNFLTKFWIWIVAITLFAVAITGDRMTLFRVVYMALFLIFVLTFQLSFQAWRKMMFVFWLVVILYSMIVLVTIYTYQFDNFPSYWRDYLHISDEQQLDIGLEHFQIKELFVRLVTPTFFVIITVIQLHYFHKDFMKLSDPKNTTIVQDSEQDEDMDKSSLQGGAAVENSEKDDPTTTTTAEFNLSEIGRFTSPRIQHQAESFLKYLHKFVNLSFLFLELHMPKLVLFFAMLVCVYDDNVIYALIVVLIALGCVCGRTGQTIAIYASSIIVSLMLLARMVYQIKYIRSEIWDVNCTFHQYDKETVTTMENDALWLGFRKTDKNKISLPSHVKWNILYILVVTVWSVIQVRQYYYKLARNRPTTRIFFMFPKITRTDADKNLRNMLKYLANYGFYKFGVEVSLMVCVLLIGIRMDMYSVFHAIWLLGLFATSRTTLSKIWIFYVLFTAITLPIQYFMVVGLPPSLCMEYPYDKSEVLIRFHDWAYLIDQQYRLPPKKLLCDFLLLLTLSRQWVVFRIEKRYAGQNYAGGSNESIVNKYEEKGFQNPVPDFITYVKTYLDIFKRGVLMSFLWVTLALVFLAGTNRVNIFSIGYLIGAFVFLWEGSDIYLRPIPRILKRWNFLIAYCVVTIVIKVLLQLVGCVFIEYIPTSSCWIVQLWGIGCVRKFGNIVTNAGLSDDKICRVPREFIGIAWDGLCFAFLIIQRRIFCSYNFFHMIDETKATTILASRGAELMEELRVKRMKEQELVEQTILEKIKLKMDKIKANQQKIEGADKKDKQSHVIDSIFSGRPKYRRRQPQTYKQAVRSGDYYMFDELEDDDIDLTPEPKPEEADEIDDSPGISELLTTAMKTDVDTVLRERQNRITRRLTMPYRRRSVRSTLSGPHSAISAPPNVDGKTLSIKEETEPYPGTSKDEDLSSEDDDDQEPIKYTLWQRIKRTLIFILAVVEGGMTTVTHFLNRYTKDYRYLVNTLKREKKILKERTNYTAGLRLGKGQVWQPSGSYNALVRQSGMASVQVTQNSDYDDKQLNSDDSDTKVMAASPLPYSSELERRKASVLTVPEIRIMAPSLERGLDSPCSSSRKSSLPQDIESYDEDEMSQYDQPVVVRMLLAIWYIIMSRSEILCYFVVFLYQTRSASFISLPLPIMVLFWGSLTVPRPTKTFWVSMIAYVEVVVLIKCVFQFEILPWNDTHNYVHHAYFPPKIIGIEKQKYYANWDLVLLLVIFFHRMMLKSMGIWSYTTSRVAGLITDGDYKLEDGKFVPVSSSSQISSRVDPGSEKTDKSTDKTDVTAQTVKDAKKEPKSITSHATEEDQILSVRSVEIDPCEYFPQNLQFAGQKYAETFKIFIQQLLDPTSRVAADVYTFMFLCDFINFFVLLIGYSSFGDQQEDSSLEMYFEENKVPAMFLFMLVMQFLLIIIDRGIYLRKNLLAKLIFQFVQIIVLHMWLFILYPLITEKEFVLVIAPQIYYMVKCIYFLFSAYQVRCGYPTRILGNFLCKDYSVMNNFMFKGYMGIPFLFELRTIMDWMWTDTSMTIMDWLKMEDIYAHIFKIKCERTLEEQYPQVRGEKKKPSVKYMVGGVLLAVVIGIIWFPLVFFSLQGAVGMPEIPTEMTLKLRIGPYEPVYQMAAQFSQIYTFTSAEFTSMQTTFNYLREAQDFIADYEPSDVAAIQLSQESANIWTISPPDKSKMLQEIASDRDLEIYLEYKIAHEQTSVAGKQSTTLVADSPERKDLYDMLNGENKTVTLMLILPKFFKVTGTSVDIVSGLMEDRDADENTRDDSLRNVTLQLFNSSSTGALQQWWKMAEDCSDKNADHFLTLLPYADCDEFITIYTFNEKAFPDTLSFLTGGGIIGLYTTIVLVASRLLRGFFAEQCFKIMFDDLPNVDRILQLCLNVYLVREAGEFALEEDLFAKLVFLFRSPETLIKWSRPKGELEDGEGDDGVGE